ncbi:hypothetical protein BDZ45DRAFT_683125 [Acephala macrosclerotiorum]|nr:hypothetical protein BDZ45DRAFT_683125 [Acephala macrosclerotiorum]
MDSSRIEVTSSWSSLWLSYDLQDESSRMLQDLPYDRLSKIEVYVEPVKDNDDPGQIYNIWLLDRGYIMVPFVALQNCGKAIVNLPDGFENNSYRSYVCRQMKSLWGDEERIGMQTVLSAMHYDFDICLNTLPRQTANTARRKRYLEWEKIMKRLPEKYKINNIKWRHFYLLAFIPSSRATQEKHPLCSRNNRRWGIEELARTRLDRFKMSEFNEYDEGLVPGYSIYEHWAF